MGVMAWQVRLAWTLRALVAALAALVCVLPLGAQSLDNSAKVVALAGQVSWLQDSYPRALSVGDMIPAGRIIVTGPDSYAKFQVSDGSTFEVFEKSQVTFRANRLNLINLLDVWIGKVKVHIEHLMNGAPNPNKVYSPTAVISVRGTTFDVIVEDEDGTTFVGVEEGLVEVHNIYKPSDTLLHSGDSVRVYRDQQLMGRQIDKGPIWRAVQRAAEEAVYRIAYGHPAGGIGVPGTSGPQGDKCPPGGCQKGGGTAPGGPGAPGAPGAPGGPH